jgi:hypothetical protein
VQQVKLPSQNKIAISLFTKVCLLACLPSCGGRQESPIAHSAPAVKEPVTHTQEIPAIAEAVTIYEAKWADLSFPVDAVYDTNTALSSDQTGALFVFTTGLSCQAILEFYRSSMEWHGWNKSGDFTYPDQTVFFYDKPLKRAIIFIQRSDNKSRVKICVGLKKIEA